MYLLRCRDCPAVYVGKTGWTFSGVRINDHAVSFENNNPMKSASARHLLDEAHLTGDEVILHAEGNFQLCRASEWYIITTDQSNLSTFEFSETMHTHATFQIRVIWEQDHVIEMENKG